MAHFESVFPGVGTVDTNSRIMRITIPDQLAQSYEAEATRLSRPLEDVITRQLETFKAVPVDSRAIVLHGATREALEIALGTSIASPQALVTAVQNLAEVSIGGEKLTFTRAQHEEIRRRAASRGVSVREELQRSLQQIQSLVFSSVTA